MIPPVQLGEVYCRCPTCGLIGWTEDDDTRPTPLCPRCDVHSEIVRDPDSSGTFDIHDIEGEPPDPAHHLGTVLTLY